MITEAEIPVIIGKVRDELSAINRDRGLHLSVENKDYKIEDDWLYVSVNSDKPGIGGFDYADALADIEEKLWAQNFENVLLVPTLGD